MSKLLKFIILTIILITLDLSSKYFFYDLNYLNGIFNTQFNLGIARSVSIPLMTTIAISLIALILFFVSYFRGYIGVLVATLLISGTLGNLIDRIFLGGVRDFIDIGIFHFPIFNLADVFLNIGIILFVIIEFWGGKTNSKN